MYHNVVYLPDQFLPSVLLADLKPSILLVLTQVISKLRWEENSYIPLPRVGIHSSSCFLMRQLILDLVDPTTLLEVHSSSLWGFSRS